MKLSLIPSRPFDLFRPEAIRLEYFFKIDALSSFFGQGSISCEATSSRRRTHLHRTAFPGTARQGRCGAVQVSAMSGTRVAGASINKLRHYQTTNSLLIRTAIRIQIPERKSFEPLFEPRTARGKGRTVHASSFFLLSCLFLLPSASIRVLRVLFPIPHSLFTIHSGFSPSHPSPVIISRRKVAHA